MMFYKFFAVIFLVSIYSNNSALAQDSNPRTKFSINESWKFIYTDKNTSFNDVSNLDWKSIKLPHTWNINDTPNDTTTYKRGIGWYKKTLNLSGSLKDKRVFLHFEAANQVAELYVNGNFVGKHIGGYTAFTFDITSYIQFKDNNRIVLKVDNRFNKNIPPLSADFTFYGGIYRDVWLITTNSIHFSLDDFGSKAIYISTPEVTNEFGSVVISGKVQNQTNSNKKIHIISTVYNNLNEEVIRVEKKIKVKSNNTIDFNLEKTVVENPNLWSPETPNLYTVKSEIYEKGRLIDLVSSSFGFRYFHFDASEGFFLNGKHLKLIGTNRHQDYEGLGNALADQLHIKDVEMIKEAGFNFLRLAHYPQDPAVLGAADRLGLILWEEIPIVNYVTNSNEFLDNSKYMLTEMIRQHYNHPSIVFWGYMNEVYLHDANGNREKEMYFPDEYLEWTKYLSKELNNLSHKEDSSRLTAIATHQNNLYDETEISNISDVVGYNLYQGWYSSYFTDFGKHVDKIHVKYPNRKILISEYGAGSDERLHSVNPKRFDFTTEYQQSYHESYLKQIKERKFIGASAVWCQSDFGSNRRGDSKPQVNQKGLQYFNRRPKDIYYYYQAALNKEPLIHIASQDWRIRISNNKQNTHLIKIYSNVSNLIIYVDGIINKTIDVNDSNIVEFDFTPTNCKHDIEVRGEVKGEIISDKLTFTFPKVSNFISNKGCTLSDISVNIGSESQFTDDKGRIWISDQQYIDNNNWGYMNKASTIKKFTKSIIESNNDPIYQHYREGIEAYHFDVDEGIYEVEVCFAELEYSKPKKRVLSVNINSKIVWQNLDLAKEYGFQTAISRKFKIIVNNSKGISVGIEAIIGSTILNGISIKRINN